MRKYKSKYGKPYIRRLKAGDLKKIKNNEECGGLWALFSQDVIELAHNRNKQVYILTMAGIGEILIVNTNKQFMKQLLGRKVGYKELTNKEFNRLCNIYKNTVQNSRKIKMEVKKVKAQVEQAEKATQQLGYAAVRATKEIAGLKGVQK